jgi:ribokinase
VLVVFGSINLDLIFAVPALPRAGDTVLTRAVRIEPGGKGANQAVAAARDGAKVVMVGAVGRDGFAAAALASLRGASVDISRIAEVAETTGIAAICVDGAGSNAIAVGSGANLLARAHQVPDALLSPETTLVLQMETAPSELAALIHRARERSTRIVLNLAPAAPLGEDALRAIDLLLVNENEASWLGSHLGTGPNASSLRAALGVDVVRTLGGEGAELATAAGHTRIPALPVVLVDTTAAGDCFTGVLAASLDRGMSVQDSAQRATAAAGLCCTRAGSQVGLPLAEETDAALNHGWGSS